MQLQANQSLRQSNYRTTQRRERIVDSRFTTIGRRGTQPLGRLSVRIRPTPNCVVIPKQFPTMIMRQSVEQLHRTISQSYTATFDFFNASDARPRPLAG
jgi:hypothetical protein